MKLLEEYNCLRRIGKQEYPGILRLSEQHLEFVSADPAVASRHRLDGYTAHRQHPKLPMIQLRFNVKKDNDASEDLTFVFKDTASAAPRLDVLKRFIALFTATFQAFQRETPAHVVHKPASSEASGAATPLPQPPTAPTPSLPPPSTVTPLQARPLPPGTTKPAGKPAPHGGFSREEQDERKRILQDNAHLQHAYEVRMANGHS